MVMAFIILSIHLFHFILIIIHNFILLIFLRLYRIISDFWAVLRNSFVILQGYDLFFFLNSLIFLVIIKLFGKSKYN